MKRILFLMAVVLLSTQLIGQEKRKTDAKKFIEQSGKLIYMEVITIGLASNLEVYVHHYTDMKSGESKSTMRIEADYVGARSEYRKIAALDSDELQGMLEALKTLQEKVVFSKPENYAEVTFTSKTGFEIGAFWKSSKEDWFLFVTLEENDGNSRFYLNKDNLIQIMSLVTKSSYEIETFKKK